MKSDGVEKKEDGQLHTLEGFAAAFIVLIAVLVAFQSVSITPTSSSTASQQVETQNYILADDLMSAADAEGALEDAILEWDEKDASFNGTREYAGETPNNEFGKMLEKVFLDEGVAYNVRLVCQYPDKTTTNYITYGDPSMNAVTTSKRIVLHSDDKVNNETGTTELENASRFKSVVCPEASENSNFHNVIEVKVTAWRM